MLRIAIFALIFISVAYLNWRWLDPEEQPTPSPLPAAIDDSDDSDDSDNLDYQKIDILPNEREAEK